MGHGDVNEGEITPARGGEAVMEARSGLIRCVAGLPGGFADRLGGTESAGDGRQRRGGPASRRT